MAGRGGDDLVIAWAAGLFEGEGSITHGVHSRTRTRRVRQLSLGMTDADVVRRFREAVGCGTVRKRKRANGRWKPMYVWTCSRWVDTERVLRAFLPYLGERRTTKALALLSDPAGNVGSPQKVTCKRGHPLRGSAADVYEWRGALHCRRCSRARVGVAVSMGDALVAVAELDKGKGVTSATVAEVTGGNARGVGRALFCAWREGKVQKRQPRRDLPTLWSVAGFDD